MKKNIAESAIVNLNSGAQPCQMDMAFKKLREDNASKPAWLRSISVMVSCDCPKCRVIC